MDDFLPLGQSLGDAVGRFDAELAADHHRNDNDNDDDAGGVNKAAESRPLMAMRRREGRSGGVSESSPLINGDEQRASTFHSSPVPASVSQSQSSDVFQPDDQALFAADDSMTYGKSSRHHRRRATRELQDKLRSVAAGGDSSGLSGHEMLSGHHGGGGAGGGAGGGGRSSSAAASMAAGVGGGGGGGTAAADGVKRAGLRLAKWQQASAGERVLGEVSPLWLYGLRASGLGFSRPLMAKVWLAFVLMLYAMALLVQPIYFMFDYRALDAATVAFDLLASVQTVFIVGATIFFASSGRLYRVVHQTVMMDDVSSIVHAKRGGQVAAAVTLAAFLITYAIDVGNFLAAADGDFFIDQPWARYFSIVVWIIPDLLYCVCMVGVFPFVCLLHMVAIAALRRECAAIVPQQDDYVVGRDGRAMVGFADAPAPHHHDPQRASVASSHLPVTPADIRRLVSRMLQAQSDLRRTAEFYSWVLGVQIIIVLTTATTTAIDYVSAVKAADGETEAYFIWIALLWFIVISSYPFLLAGAMVFHQGRALRLEVAALFARLVAASKQGVVDADTVAAARDLLRVSQSDACAFEMRVGGITVTTGFWFSVTAFMVTLLVASVRIRDNVIGHAG